MTMRPVHELARAWQQVGFSVRLLISPWKKESYAQRQSHQKGRARLALTEFKNFLEVKALDLV